MGRCIYKENNLTRKEFQKQLTDMVADDIPTSKISEQYDVSPVSIHNWLNKFDILRRPKLRSKEYLYQKYITEKQSMGKIGKELGVTWEAVSYYIGKFKIPKRSFKEAQQNRDRTTEKPNGFHSIGSNTKLRSYCFYFNKHWYPSIGEFLYWFNNHKTNTLNHQPFVYKNRRPDFLVNNSVVIEIKCESSTWMSDEFIDRFNEYIVYGNDIKEHFGYDYKIIFAKDIYKPQYNRFLKWCKAKGNSVGESFTLSKTDLYEILNGKTSDW